VREDFEQSIRKMAARLRPPDLLLVSGDLTNRGRTKEFRIANRFLDALLEWLGEAGGPEPLIIPVPGNHDLIRPEGMDALSYRVFESYDQGADDKDVRMLDEKLWTERDASFVKPLFKDYLTWLGRRIVPELKQRAATFHRSHFPGDLCVEIEIPGTFPLCIVALNSAWLQYSDAEFAGKLALPRAQFHAALPAAKGSSPLEVFQRCERALLMMHHPPGWLSERARGIFRESIYAPQRFDLCLHGHLHEARTDVVHWNEGQLPEGRSRVYRAVVRWLIAARTELRQQQEFTDRFAWRAFARLALAMVNAEKGKRSIFDLEDGAVAVDAVVRRDFSALEPEDRRHRAREWLRFECLGSGIVEEVAGNRIRFWHLTFQEFLAALQLAWRNDGENDADEDWWPLVRERLDHAPWRETIELFPGCLLDEGGEGRVDKLLDRVLALRGPAPDLATEARIAGIVGRLLQPLTVYHYRPRAEIAAAYEAALERSMAIFTVAGAREVPVKDRIAVAEALGRGGDPRLAAERDNFIEVPGCGGLRLGKYPVTIEEYQRFVEHRGYEEENLWDAEGSALRLEKEWEYPGLWDDQLTTPNRPVVRVSWYEAMAYCRWLSEQQNRKVRLPSGAEWEKAATPVKGEYPWGAEEPDEERANFAPEWKPNVGSPTPVGVYPGGD